MSGVDDLQQRLSQLYRDPAELAIDLFGIDWPPPVEDLAPSGGFAEIDECGAALVDSAEALATFDVYDEFGVGDEASHLVRDLVLSKLISVHESLPQPFGLVLIEGWRSQARQELLFAIAQQSAGDAATDYAADPRGVGGVVPPHSTGGAVDVTLSWNGHRLGLSTAVGIYDTRSSLTWLESSAESVARDLRRLLYHSMVAQGFVGIAEEWWHYSYGDQQWAVRTGAPAALFGSTTPR